MPVVGALLRLIALLTLLAARCTDSSAIARPPARRLATERPIAGRRVGAGEALKSVGSEGNKLLPSTAQSGRRARHGHVPL